MTKIYYILLMLMISSCNLIQPEKKSLVERNDSSIILENEKSVNIPFPDYVPDLKCEEGEEEAENDLRNGKLAYYLSTEENEIYQEILENDYAICANRLQRHLMKYLMAINAIMTS